MITSRPTVRSKRRQSSLALFGRSVERVRVEAALERSPTSLTGFHDATPSDRMHDERADGGLRQADFDAMLTRLQREAQADPRLRAVASNGELAALIEETARALWMTSRVKTFVPLLAMRRVYESLGLADATPEEKQLTGHTG